jgi:hypothetical protein
MLMGLITIKRNLVNSRMENTTARGRIEPKVKEKGNAKLLNVINVMVQTTLVKKCRTPNTWLNYTKEF